MEIVNKTFQVAFQAHVRVWRSDNLDTLHVLGVGMFEKSAACVAFAPGKVLIPTYYD